VHGPAYERFVPDAPPAPPPAPAPPADVNHLMEVQLGGDKA
jgi:hypothetical protein